MNSILFFCLLILVGIESYLFNHDYMNPSIIMAGTYLISAFVLMLHTGAWGNISLTTFAYIIGANIIMLSIGYSLRPRFAAVTNSRGCIITDVQTYIIVLFNLIVGILFYKEVCRIAYQVGASSRISSIMSNYRRVMLFSEMSDTSVGFNQIVMQMMKVSIGFAYVSLYKIIELTQTGYRIKDLKNYCFIIFSFLCIAWEQSSRLVYLQFILAGIVMIGVFSKSINLKVFYRNNKKIVNRILMVCIAFVFLFFVSRNFLGRNITTKFWDYVSVYTSGSIVAFDQFLKNSSELLMSNIHQKETFGAIYRFLYKLGIISYAESTSLDFVYIANSGKTNVYTAMRRWINDYGLIGMIVLQSIFAFFFSKLYRVTREKRLPLVTLVYSFLFIAVATHFFDDMLYKNYCSMSFLIQLACFCLCYFFMEKVRIFI